MTIKPFYGRRFLDRRGFHAGAYVLAYCKLEAIRPRTGGPWCGVDAEFTVADCARIVTLDFSADDGRDAQNALHKARLLRDVMVDFTAALVAAVEEWRHRQT